MKSPPSRLPHEGVLLGYSLEHERRTAPIGFVYGPADTESLPDDDEDVDSPTLDPILHTGGGHLMTIAPTGGGKGVGCIIPSLLRFEGPVIVVDPKGENYAVTADRRRELGQEVVVLDPIGVTGAPEVGALNPLDLIDPDEAQSVDDSAALASLLTGGVEKEDPRNLFWYQRGEQLLAGIIQFVAVERDDDDRHLAEVRRILNLPADDFIRLANTEMAQCSDPEVRQVAGSLVNPAEETIGSILSMAQNSVGFLRGELLLEATAASSFELASVTAGDPLSIYLVIPPDKLESHRNLLRVWIGTLMSALMRRRSPVPRPTLLILDEAAQLGSLEQLRQAITLMRGYGLQTWSFWQDVSQLRNLYPRDWETMYNNCRVHQAFGLTTLKAATVTCDLLGFHDPIEALQLDADEMILSVSGDEAVIAQKPNYLGDPAFQGLYSPNPFYTKTSDRPPAPRRPRRRYVRPSRVVIETDQPSEKITATLVESDESDEKVDEPEEADDAGTVDFAELMTEVAPDGEPEVATTTVYSAFEPLPNVEVGYAASVPGFLEAVVNEVGGSWSPIMSQLRQMWPKFYPRHDFTEVIDPTHEPKQLIAVQHRNDLRVFHDGEPTLATLNRRVPIQLDDDNVADYLRFYFHFARPRDRRVRIVESLDQVSYWTGIATDELERFQPNVAPLQAAAVEPDGWSFQATALSAGSLGSIQGRIDPDGNLEGVDWTATEAIDSLVTSYPMVSLLSDPDEPVLSPWLGEIHGEWETLAGAELERFINQQRGHRRTRLTGDLVFIRRPLRCYPSHDLVVVLGDEPGSPRKVTYCFDTRGQSHWWLSGSSLQTFNVQHLDLDVPGAAEDYIRFRTWSLGRPDSYWLLLDRFEHLPLASAVGEDERRRLIEAWSPLEVKGPIEGDAASVKCRVRSMFVHGGRVAQGDFVVEENGDTDLKQLADTIAEVDLDDGRMDRVLALPPLGRRSGSRLGLGQAPPAARGNESEDSRPA